MKIRYLLCIICVTLTLASATSAFAGTEDFYISDFTADYYLTKQEDGTSKLHVKEVLTAVFPETDQNHGIRGIYLTQIKTARIEPSTARLPLTLRY